MIVAASTLLGPVSPVTARVAAPSVRMLSATPAGVPGNQGGSDPAMTPDGRYVAFASASTNLVPNDINHAADVFVRDTKTGAIERVSVNSNGGQGLASTSTCTNGTTARGSGALDAGGAGSPAISADGRYVAFVSCFVNLVTPPSTFTQVYVHDRKTGKTTVGSVNAKGAPANSFYTSPAVMSADGRYVVFASTATNLADGSCAGDPTAVAWCDSPITPIIGLQGWQVYRHDMVTGQTTLMSVSTQGARGDGESYAAFVSPDGRYVGFQSTSDNLTGVAAQRCLGAIPACEQVYLRDTKSRTTQLVSVGIDGRAGNGPAGDGGSALGDMTHAYAEQMSADNRYVLFMSAATNLIPHSPLQAGEAHWVFVRDLKLGRTEHVSVNSTGGFPGSDSIGEPTFSNTQATMSPDGRYVSFWPNCDSWWGASGVWIHDRVTGATDYAVPTRWGNPPSCSAHGDNGTPPPGDRLLIGNGGRVVVFGGTPGAFFAGGDQSGDAASYQVLLADRGPALGVGPLIASGRLSVAGAPGFRSTGVVSMSGPAARDAGLRAASVAYRAQRNDMFVRLDVGSLDVPGVVYGLDLTNGAARYEIRATSVGPLSASFGLYRATSVGWTRVADLSGGYGTTGNAVVVAVPLRLIGAANGARLSGLRAFAQAGPSMLSELALSD